MITLLPGLGSAEPACVRRQWSTEMNLGMVVLPLLECGDEPVCFFAAQAALFPSVGIETSDEQAWLGIEPQAKLAEYVQFAQHEVGGEGSWNVLKWYVCCGEKGVQPPAMVR